MEQLRLTPTEQFGVQVLLNGGIAAIVELIAHRVFGSDMFNGIILKTVMLLAEEQERAGTLPAPSSPFQFPPTAPVEMRRAVGAVEWGRDKARVVRAARPLPNPARKLRQLPAAPVAAPIRVAPVLDGLYSTVPKLNDALAYLDARGLLARPCREARASFERESTAIKNCIRFLEKIEKTSRLKGRAGRKSKPEAERKIIEAISREHHAEVARLSGGLVTDGGETDDFRVSAEWWQTTVKKHYLNATTVKIKKIKKDFYNHRARAKKRRSDS
jgi:hypothetical protein